jgi:hypothetical protein
MNIKEIKKFQTSDGSVFDTVEEARSYEWSLNNKQSVSEINMDSINFYLKTNQSKYVPVKFFDVTERFDFVWKNEDGEYLLLLRAAKIEYFDRILEIALDDEVAGLLFREVVNSGHECSLETVELQSLIEILGEDWCCALHKDDVLRILGAVQILPEYIYQ